jgi:tyrosine decarboxylase/aspartate 1-decarboxylase
MNEEGMSEDGVIKLLEEARSMDIDYRRVFSSMCTIPHPIAVKAYDMFIASNAGDPGIFRGTKKLEEETIGIIGELLHKRDAYGYISTGGTESNLQAIRMARNIKKRERPNFVVSEMGHFSFEKGGDILGVETRRAEVKDDLTVDINSVKELIDENTIGIVGIAGTTEFGQIDPIDELSKIALKEDLFLHVDAAFGGFVIPFLKKKYPFDFELEGVSSISIDSHKMGLSVIPAGGLLVRRKEDLKELEVDTPYLSSKSQYTLSGTRSGAAIAAVYAVLKYLGRKGLKKIVGRCLDLTNELVDRMRGFDVHPVGEPKMNVLALNVPNLDTVFKELWENGWCVSMTRRPRALRLVIMPHIDGAIIEEFSNDLSEMISNTDG